MDKKEERILEAVRKYHQSIQPVNESFESFRKSYEKFQEAQGAFLPADERPHVVSDTPVYKTHA